MSTAKNSMKKRKQTSILSNTFNNSLRYGNNSTMNETTESNNVVVKKLAKRLEMSNNLKFSEHVLYPESVIHSPKDEKKLVISQSHVKRLLVRSSQAAKRIRTSYISD